LELVVGGAYLVSGFMILVSMPVGLPFAAALKGVGAGRVALAADAFLFGMIYVALSVTIVSWVGWPALVLVVVAWAATAGWAWRQRRVTPAPRRSWGAVSRRRGFVLLVVGWVVVLVGAMALRPQVADFLPWIGDMGAYVNWANEFARTGTLNTGWPPLFSAYLGVASFVFGSELTTAGVPALGLMLIVAVARLLDQLRAPRVIVLGAAVALALHPHAIWYSTFPASESFASALLVVWFILVHRTVRRGSASAAWAAAIVMIAMCLLRTSAVALLPVVVGVALAVAVVPRWRDQARSWAWITVGATIGAAVSHWYGISQIRPYYVEIQLPEFLPGRLMSALHRAGLFDPGVLTLVVLVVSVAGASVLIAWLGSLVARSVDGTDERAAGPEWFVFGAAAASVLGLGLLMASGYETWRITERMGLWYLAGVLLAVTLAGSLRRRSDQTLVVLMVGVAASSLALHSYRLEGARVHLFFLYWDRYLVSEYLPVAVVLTFLALVVLTRRALLLAGRLGPAGVVQRWLTPVAAAATVGLMTILSWSQVSLATSGVFLDGSHALTEKLAEIAESEGSPVLWSADGHESIENLHYPNTWTVFARPLAWTFGIDMVNADMSGTEPDDVPGAGDLRTRAACAGTDTLTVFEVARGGVPLDERVEWMGLDVDVIATQEGAIDLLSQGVYSDDWYSVEFEITAWRVRVPQSLQVECPT
jgi:hypothetical protein